MFLWIMFVMQWFLTLTIFYYELFLYDLYLYIFSCDLFYLGGGMINLLFYCLLLFYCRSQAPVAYVSCFLLYTDVK
jgi:hypothetical protein